MNGSWLKQTGREPLYPDLLWSRPENRTQAGKLLILGGSAQGVAAAGVAYESAGRAGVGTAKVLLPDSLQKSMGPVFEAGDYAPSTPSGSFSQRALGELLALSQWADGVLIAGDLGRNSETAILLDKFVSKYDGQLTITQDAANYFVKTPGILLNRPDTLLVVSFSQLQKIAMSASFTRAFKFDMNIINLVEALRDFTKARNLSVITMHLDNILVAVNGQVSSTAIKDGQTIWRVRIAAQAAVWWLQNPAKPFEALTTAVLPPGVDN